MIRLVTGAEWQKLKRRAYLSHKKNKSGPKTLKKTNIGAELIRGENKMALYWALIKITKWTGYQV